MLFTIALGCRAIYFGMDAMSITLQVQRFQDAILAQPLDKHFDQLGAAIGRAEGNDLVLEDPTKYISRVHAKLDFHDGGYYLTDVGSNPSLINDRPIGRGQPMLLQDGDQLNIGDYQLRVSVKLLTASMVLPPSPLQMPTVSETPISAVQFEDGLSSASILDVDTNFDFLNFDPLGGNLLDTPSVGSGVSQSHHLNPDGSAFYGTESDHVSPEIQSFTLPVPIINPAVVAIPVHPGVMAIPDDYDPLADFLPPRLAATPVVLMPTAQGQAIVKLAPVFLPEHDFLIAPSVVVVESTIVAHTPAPDTSLAVENVAPITVVVDVANSSASIADTSNLAASAQAVITPSNIVASPVPIESAESSDSDQAVIDALLRGLGVTDLKTSRSPVELAGLVGTMLREATAGTMGVLIGRALAKREGRLEMTMMSSQANNPLKFFPNADMALSQMLSSTHPGYMAPMQAYTNAYDDLKAHELATIAGMRAALAGVLVRFDPVAIEQRLQVPTVMDKMMASNRKAKMWDRLVELYKEMSNDADADFQRLFGEQFSAAYEEQIQRLR